MTIAPDAPANASRPSWIAGDPWSAGEVLEVTAPWDGALVGTATVADPDAVEAAIAAAAAAGPELAALPAHVRADALRQVADGLRARHEEAAQLISAEAGKPIRWARVEVDRALSVLTLAAEEAVRFTGEVERLDRDPGGVGRMAITRRFPRGPVLAITPFNFPLNLVVHKVAPALAVGTPIIVKPAPSTPLSALLLGELIAQTDLPGAACSVVVVPNDRAGDLAADPRLAVISFTGSDTVGWAIREAHPRKHVTLELGGNAAAVVCDDWTDPDDLAHAVARIAAFATVQAGQTCISVQHVLVPDGLVDEVSELLVEELAGLATGDPADEATHVGPVIDERAAERVESWITEAVAAGGRVLTGGTRQGTTISPTLLVDVPADVRVSCEEVFGPVVLLSGVASLDDAVARINASRYGLQTGVFTHDVRVATRLHRDLDVGGVIIGDIPSYRADQLPYGGNKDSGIGREGVRSTMTDYTEARALVFSGLDL